MTICGHIEAVISTRIKSRLKSIEIFIQKSTVDPARFQTKDELETIPIDALVDSIQSINTSLQREVRSAPLSKLVDIFRTVFPSNLQAALGPLNYSALFALADLRNAFAHSREIIFNVELGGEKTLEGSALEKPIKLLRQVNIAQPAGKNDQSSDFDILYQDVALLFFFRRVKEIEEKLIEYTQFGPSDFPDYTVPNLPEIEA